MAIKSLPDLSGLSDSELYSVYLAVAEADHRWRHRAMYGSDVPPRGHSVFRPLPRADFNGRLKLARHLVGGEAAFRGRLGRQAAAYRIDLPQVLRSRRPAA